MAAIKWPSQLHALNLSETNMYGDLGRMNRLPRHLHFMDLKVNRFIGYMGYRVIEL